MVLVCLELMAQAGDPLWSRDCLFLDYDYSIMSKHSCQKIKPSFPIILHQSKTLVWKNHCNPWTQILTSHKTHKPTVADNIRALKSTWQKFNVIHHPHSFRQKVGNLNHKPRRHKAYNGMNEHISFLSRIIEAGSVPVGFYVHIDNRQSWETMWIDLVIN